MASTKGQYLLEEPTTGLYTVLTANGPRLATAREASRFASARAAALAANRSGLTDQPHDLVRIDA